ncbi:hypothetical protein BU26DRAFT_558887 [Trematosphaeria pertusa]|uniref:Uncharacterized protein n=1 Tax=Trematosphaeria pertusa TaxID=390896 RepID=A0A6A6IUS3_9PLEO|nr:uncharacterized protein BU26DRAFT_558887 [Trematosphaeria pertusa]KAF2254169.1 hypothetical protein BU26DRAFT_558887 [Trematosphaeria pertusa]
MLDSPRKHRSREREVWRVKGSWKIRIKSAIKASSPSSILKATPRPPPSCKASAAVHVSLQLLQARQSPSTVTIVTLFLRQQSPLNRKSPFYSDRRLMTRAVAYARITSKDYLLYILRSISRLSRFVYVKLNVRYLDCLLVDIFLLFAVPRLLEPIALIRRHNSRNAFATLQVSLPTLLRHVQ